MSEESRPQEEQGKDAETLREEIRQIRENFAEGETQSEREVIDTLGSLPVDRLEDTREVLYNAFYGTAPVGRDTKMYLAGHEIREGKRARTDINDHAHEWYRRLIERAGKDNPRENDLELPDRNQLIIDFDTKFRDEPPNIPERGEPTDQEQHAEYVARIHEAVDVIETLAHGDEEQQKQIKNVLGTLSYWSASTDQGSALSDYDYHNRILQDVLFAQIQRYSQADDQSSGEFDRDALKDALMISFNYDQQKRDIADRELKARYDALRALNPGPISRVLRESEEE